jgi:hypothetical protein
MGILEKTKLHVDLRQQNIIKKQEELKDAEVVECSHHPKINNDYVSKREREVTEDKVKTPRYMKPTEKQEINLLQNSPLQNIHLVHKQELS